MKIKDAQNKQDGMGKETQEFTIGRIILFMSFFPSIYVFGKLISTL